MSAPLADRLRPKNLEEVVGQSHLLGPGKIIRRIAGSGRIPNMIFYGPSGVGKTTVASIIAGSAGKRLHRLNGTTASTSDIRAIVGELDTFAGMDGVLLYLDEIQYLNKKQQQSLLEFMEDGRITLIASTTENPYFYIYNAILSRSTVFEFKPVEAGETRKAVERAFSCLEDEMGVRFDPEAGVDEALCAACGGDVRRAINAVEMIGLAAKPQDGRCPVTMEMVREVTHSGAARYDRDGDEHYDILSAFQKSVRGSDENAALHYLARLIEAGDLISPCRRLLVMAAEDIGLAYPQAASIVKACVDSAMQLGLPEARIPLAEAVILLCTSPKSNSAICAIDAAIADLKSGRGGEIPPHLKDAHYQGAGKLGRGTEYRYPHDYPGHWVSQQYLPDEIRDAEYYRYGDNRNERAAKAYREAVKKAADGDQRA
ncbi:MAG TPA: replication-associated recombination protein A [Clostridia bacterium]|nr:replication-associated recombination protein A [Clostridia bacterium]